MKKGVIILLIIFLLFGFVGCKNDEKETISQFDVDNVNELIELIPDEITESNRELIETIRAQYDKLNDLEKALIVNYEKLEYAESVLKSIDEENARIEAETKRIKTILEGYEEELDEVIPEKVNDNIELPSEFEAEEGRIIVIWKTSDPFTFSHSGVVIPGRKDIEVNITTELRYVPEDPTLPRDVVHVYQQKVIVEALEFEPLPEKDIVFAYAYNGNGFNDLAIETIDVVNHAFSSVVNGTVSVGGSGRSQLLELRKKGVRVSLCIGGYKEGSIPFSEAASTELGRLKLAQSIVQAIEKYHFDGVDIDWEYPGYDAAPGISAEQDKQNYTAFIQVLRRLVKNANEDYLVTAAIPGGPYNTPRFELGKLNNYLDYFLVMTYDLHAQTHTSHHTALHPSSFTSGGCSISETIKYYTDRNVSKEKIVVGAAFYGRLFEKKYEGNPLPYPSGVAEYRSSINYKHIKDNYLSKIETGEVIRFWDDQAKAPYVYNKVTNVFITYDDPESIRYKIEYIKDEGLAGIMFWEFSQDNGELLGAINEHM
ncbi:MAG TPA: hypothetical protein GXZ48_00850 [Acholeplasmataceae bacterium]|nr:hypothetical protein [Acholeplasmataceae bacterium]